MRKKVLSLFLAIIMILSVTTSVFAADDLSEARLKEIVTELVQPTFSELDSSASKFVKDSINNVIGNEDALVKFITPLISSLLTDYMSAEDAQKLSNQVLNNEIISGVVTELLNSEFFSLTVEYAVNDTIKDLNLDLIKNEFIDNTVSYIWSKPLIKSNCYKNGSWNKSAITAAMILSAGTYKFPNVSDLDINESTIQTILINAAERAAKEIMLEKATEIENKINDYINAETLKFKTDLVKEITSSLAKYQIIVELDETKSIENIFKDLKSELAIELVRLDQEGRDKLYAELDRIIGELENRAISDSAIVKDNLTKLKSELEVIAKEISDDFKIRLVDVEDDGIIELVKKIEPTPATNEARYKVVTLGGENPYLNNYLFDLKVEGSANAKMVFDKTDGNWYLVVTPISELANGDTDINIIATATVNAHGKSKTFQIADRKFILRVTEEIPPTKYTLTVNASPTIGGIVTGGGQFIEGQEVNITATPSAGYDFIGWTENTTLGSTFSPSSATTTITMPATNVELVATFKLQEVIPVITITATSNPAEGGVVSFSRIGTTNQFNISATANSGYKFDGWSRTSGTGTFINSMNPSTVYTSTSNNSGLLANFVLDTNNSGGNGNGNGYGNGTLTTPPPNGPTVSAAATTAPTGTVADATTTAVKPVQVAENPVTVANEVTPLGSPTEVTAEQEATPLGQVSVEAEPAATEDTIKVIIEETPLGSTDVVKENPKTSGTGRFGINLFVILSSTTLIIVGISELRKRKLAK